MDRPFPSVVGAIMPSIQSPAKFFIASVAALLAACGSDDGGSAPLAQQPYGEYVSAQYAGGGNWLCHPLADRDYCLDDLSATVVYANGSIEVEPHHPATDPAIDCFYVYPTWSLDNAGNSDLDASEDEEGFVVKNQAARLNAVCRVFAPVYRQVTIPALFDPSLGGDSELAQSDVVDAFKHYIANDNRGRGFVLVGHSQGASRLRALIASEVEPEPYLRQRLVSAILLGAAVAVPEGEDVGGSFTTIPACRAVGQTGCVISYSSYRATAPASTGGLFGTAAEGFDAICTNPVGLSNDRRVAKPYFSTRGSTLVGGAATWLFADPDTAPQIATPFVTLPDFVELQCAKTVNHDTLEVTLLTDPEDARADDIGGTLENLLPGWGLHIVDANIAMGDLLDLVREQAAAYAP